MDKDFIAKFELGLEKLKDLLESDKAKGKFNIAELIAYETVEKVDLEYQKGDLYTDVQFPWESEDDQLRDIYRSVIVPLTATYDGSARIDEIIKSDKAFFDVIGITASND